MNDRMEHPSNEDCTGQSGDAAWTAPPAVDGAAVLSPRLHRAPRWVCASLLGAGLALVPGCRSSPEPDPCADGCYHPAYAVPVMRDVPKENQPRTMPPLEYFHLDMVPLGAPRQVAELLEAFARSVKHCLHEVDDRSPLENARLALELTMEGGVLMDASILSPLRVLPEVQRCVREAAARTRHARHRNTREETRNYWKTWLMHLSWTRSGPPRRVWPMTSGGGH